MNETYYLKLTGKVNVPNKVEIGHNYKITIDGSVTEEKREDNEDGTFSITSTFRPILAEIQKDHGEIVKSKDVRKRSQQIRAFLYRMWEADAGDSRGHEEAYDQTMKYILANIDEIYEKARR
jgi:hypothetical protein